MDTDIRIRGATFRPEEELSLTRRQFQAVMNAQDTVILVVDKDLIVRFANKNLGELWDLDPASLIGKYKPEAITGRIKYLFEEPEKFKDRLFWLYDHPHETAYDEVVMIRPQRRLFTRYSAPVLDDDNNILGRVEVYTDITKERALEQALQQRNEELLAFRDIAVVVNQSLNLGEILKTALEKLLEVMQVEGGCICLEEMPYEAQHRHIYLGMSAQMRDEVCLHCRDVLLSLSDIEKESAQILQSNLTNHPQVLDRPEHHNCETLAIAPLVSKTCVLGRICLTSKASNPLLEKRRSILTLIACQIGAAVENANLYAETQRRQHMEHALNKVGMQILASFDLESILQTVAQEARAQFQCDSSGIALVDEKDGKLHWRSAAGHCSMQSDIAKYKCSSPLSLSKCPLRDSSVEEGFSHLMQPMSKPRVSIKGQIEPALLWVPMRADSKLIGGICVKDSNRPTFSEGDAALLSGLANQAAIALENAALYDQVQQIAMLEERDSIARGLHDGLAQVLGYLKLKVETVERWLDLNEQGRVRSELASMNEVINETYEDVRGAIMGLRTLIQPGPDLLSSLDEALQRFGLDHNIKTQLVGKRKDFPSLSLEMQIQLIRVVQECLNNVAKHANASKVIIEFQKNAKGVRITIIDDGHGFNPSRLTEPSWRYMGIRMSRERVESVGGSFQIKASIGHGTEVIVHLPVQKEI